MSGQLKTISALRDDDAPLERIRRYIKDPPENSRIFTITPDVAQILLTEFNRDNRPRKPTSITQYAQHMLDDFWLLTGDTIKFSDAGRLLDGQNRLHACVRSDTAFRSHVVFGIGDDVFSMLDRGKNRTASDLLAIAGYTHTHALQAAIRWVWMIVNNRVTHRDSLEPENTLRLVQHQYTTLPDFIKPARAIYDTTRQPMGMVMALLYCFDQANSKEQVEFAKAWGAGQVGGKFKPLELLTKATTKIQNDSSGRVHEVVRCALCIKAWNLYRQGRKGTLPDLRWKLNGAEDFPVIAK